MNKLVKIFFINIFLLILIISCGLVDSGEYNLSYFPLEVGNEWTYQRVGSGTWTNYISSKRTIGDKEYFVMSSKDIKDEPPIELLYREENNIIYRLIDNKEYVHLDFTRLIGDKWQKLPYERYIHIDSFNDEISVESGTFSNCIRIISESDLDYSEIWFAPGIGKVASKKDLKVGIIIGSPYSSLIHCIINGKQIP